MEKYLKITEETKINFVKEMERSLIAQTEQDTAINLQSLENMMSQTSKKEMEVTIRKKLRKDTKEETEPIWFNKEISKRRNINKMRQKATTNPEKFIYDELYFEQKIKVQKLVREAINKHEKKITE